MVGWEEEEEGTLPYGVERTHERNQGRNQGYGSDGSGSLLRESAKSR